MMTNYDAAAMLLGDIFRFRINGPGEADEVALVIEPRGHGYYIALFRHGLDEICTCASCMIILDVERLERE